MKMKGVSIRSYRFAVIGFGLLWCCRAAQAANIPAWWHTRGLVNTNLSRNDYAPANIGQLKNVAYQTWVEVSNQVAGVRDQVTGVESRTNIWNAAHITAANNESQIANLQSELSTSQSDIGNLQSEMSSNDARFVNITGDTMTGSLTIQSSLVVGNGTATGLYAVAEGENTIASGNYSHAEGFFTTASADFSHAEGIRTLASACE